MSPPERRRLLLRRWRCSLGLLLALAPAAVPALLRAPVNEEDPRSAYAQATPDNVIARLQKRIDSGQVTLAYDSKQGYLPAVLKALQIPASSQMLVFSKTSVQKELISPQTPRALYFNDDAYVGYLPDAKALEIATTDPQWGPVYYVLLQKPRDKPIFFRTVDACLECHATRTTHYVPEHLMHSVYADTDGTPLPKAPTYETTDESPLEERWGGWYVTGKHGNQRHMGNALATMRDGAARMDREKGANLTDLRGRFDTSSYLTPHSDIVALMALAHQTHLQNLITQAHYQTRAALLAAKTAHSAGAPPDAVHAENAPDRIQAACEPLVKAMLFVDEAPLKAPITGTTGFAEQFAARGPRDRKHRSLRELDLKRRLLRYPCSYTIYSEAFDALPDPAKDYLFRRLQEVLSGRDRSKEFAPLSAADRKAIREILLETKPAFAAWVARR